MKKLVLFTIVLLAMNVSFAQVLPFTFGPKISISATKFNIKDVQTTGLSDLKDNSKFGTLGYSGGIFLRLSIKKIYIQPEAYFIVKGGKINMKPVVTLDNGKVDVGAEVNPTITIPAIDIPLLLGYKIVDLEVFNFRVFAGPVYSIVLNKNISLKDPGKDINADDLKKDFNSHTMSIQAGIGADIIKKLTIDIRYDLGISKLSSNIGGMKNNLKNNMFFLSIGWAIL